MSRLAALARALRTRLRALLSGGRLDAELDEEIRFHIDQQANKNLRAGMSPEQARRAAYVAFGGVARIQEEHRDSRGVRLLEDMGQDLAFAYRGLRSNPGHSLAAIMALAIGIGATTSVFSSVSALVLHPLPFPDLDRVVLLFETAPQIGVEKATTSPATFRDWKAEQVFEQLAAYQRWKATLIGTGEPERVHGVRATPELFALLGIEPELGRTFAPGEDLPGSGAVVVLSYSFWQRRFAGDPDVLGTRLRIGGHEMVVVGVAPDAHTYPLGTDVWAPLILNEQEWSSRQMHGLQALGRLAENQSLQQAREQLDALAGRLSTTYPDTMAGKGVRLVPLLEEINFGTRHFVLFLMGAAGFVLLLACANVANLQLARGTVRCREMALRRALGASRFRLVRQLLTESLVLAAVATVAGVLIAELGNRLTHAAVPYEIRHFVVAGLEHLSIDWRVLSFAATTAIGAALVFGLVPALRSSRTDLSAAIKEGGGGTSSPGGGRARVALVIVEVGLAIVLLAGAGLMIQGFGELSRSDRGFIDRDVLTLRIELAPKSYPAEHEVRDFFERSLDALQALPESESVALTNTLPALGAATGTGFLIEGRPPPEPDRPNRADLQIVSADYFTMLRIPMLEGRGFRALDTAESGRVAIVSSALARRYWPAASPLGKRIQLPSGDGDWITIIGLVDDVSRNWLDTVPAWTLYRPYTQAPTRQMTILLKSTADPAVLLPEARDRVWAIDPGQPIADTRTLERMFSDQASGIRLASRMMAVFAVAALLLCTGGIYALLAYSAVQRSQEIGVRLALGARPANVLGLFVRDGLKLTLIGLAFGLPAAYLLAWTLSSYVLDVLSLSLPVLGALALLLLTVAAAASTLPALRAARVDPAATLRAE